MEELSQLPNSKRIALGWYGRCECDDYDLTSEDNKVEVSKIDHIYEINGSDTSRPIFYSTYADHVHGDTITQSLTTLKCGRAYYVVLKKGNDKLNIPSFEFTDSNTTESKRLIDMCFEEGPAPELSLGGEFDKQYREYEVGVTGLETELLIVHKNIDLLTMNISGPATAWQYTIGDGEKLQLNAGDTNLNITPSPIKITFYFKDGLQAGNNVHKLYDITIKLSGQASSKKADGETPLYDNAIKSKVFKGKVFDRILKYNKSSVVLNDQENTVKVPVDLVHTYTKLSNSKWTFKDVNATNFNAVNKGGSDVVFDLDNVTFNDSKDISLELNCNEAPASNWVYPVELGVESYGIHETDPNTNYKKLNGDDYAKLGQITDKINTSETLNLVPSFSLTSTSGSGSNRFITREYQLTQDGTGGPSDPKAIGFTRKWIGSYAITQVNNTDNAAAWEINYNGEWEDLEGFGLDVNTPSKGPVKLFDIADSSNNSPSVKFRLKADQAEGEYNCSIDFTATPAFTHKDKNNNDFKMNLELRGTVTPAAGAKTYPDLWIGFLSQQQSHFSKYWKVLGYEGKTYDVEFSKISLYNMIVDNPEVDCEKATTDSGYIPCGDLQPYGPEDLEAVGFESLPPLATDENGDPLPWPVIEKDGKTYGQMTTSLDVTEFEITDPNFATEIEEYKNAQQEGGGNKFNMATQAILLHSKEDPNNMTQTQLDTLMAKSFRFDNGIKLNCGNDVEGNIQPKEASTSTSSEMRFIVPTSTGTATLSYEVPVNYETFLQVRESGQWKNCLLFYYSNVGLSTVPNTNDIATIQKFYFVKNTGGDISNIKFSDNADNPSGGYCS
jgi:hypothetical protein